MLGPFSFCYPTESYKLFEYILNVLFSHIYKHFQGKFQGTYWEMESLLEKKNGAGKTRSLHGKSGIFTLHSTQKLTQMDNRRKHEGLILLEENDSRKISCDLG